MRKQKRHAGAVESYFAAVDAEDYARVAALFAPDGELVAPGTAPRRGAAAIEAYFAAALAPFPEHRDAPTRVVHAGGTVCVEVRFTGRLGSGALVEFDALDLFDFDAGGRIARLSSWYDSHAVRTRLREARAVETTG
jgi:ketosteroid isomerase-like protein